MLPTKLHSGQNFKTATVNKVNEIIDYLKSQRIVGDNKTLKVNQLTSGIGLSVISNGAKSSGGSSSFNHPFKLTITDDGEGTPLLNVQDGRITVSNNTQDRTWIPYSGENALDLSELSTSGEYLVALAIQFDPTGSGDDNDNSYFPCSIYFVNGDATTNLVPGTRGFYTTVIGRISLSIEDNERHFSVVRQDLVSDLFIEFNSLNHPFSITAQSDAFEDGILKNDYDLSDFSFHVQEGTVIMSDTEISISESDFTVNEPSHVYCSIDENTLSGSIITTTSGLQYHDTQTKTYNYLIGKIMFNAENYGLMIEQYIHDTISMGSETYKVKTISGDAQPDFLSAKFEFGRESEEYPLSGYSKSLIGGDCVSADVTEQGLSGTQFKVKPIWMWMEISDYNKNEEQYLLNKSGTLKWEDKPKPLEVSGSLAGWEEVKVVSGKPILRWKPEYISGNTEQFYFMGSSRNGTDSSEMAVLSGVSFGQDPGGQEKDAVMIWSRDSGLPNITIPPSATQTVSSWVLAGTLNSGLSWKPYTSGNIELTGSITNVFELVDDQAKQYLRVKSEYDNTIDQFHFLNLEADGTLSATSFFGDPEVEGECSIMTWNYENLEPQVFFCPEGREDDDLILAGSKEDGLYWVGLYAAISSEIMELSAYLSGELYKVKASVQDPSGDFLYSKVASVSSSILLSLEQDVDQYVNFEINPDYFYSSDNSIAIEETEDGLDFTISAYLVQVSDDDEPDYLFDKITSMTASISASIVDSGEYEQVSLDINPNYFYSSDNSISIEETEDGLDFTLSSYMVQVSEDDEPDFLFDKITSETASISASIVDSGEYEQVSLDINPAYFFCSDGSISIEDTGNGLDFTLSSAVVSVSEGDEPDFLFDKITSETGSISASIVDSGEYEQVSLDINPDYFYSSDGSISIEEDSNGLDFTISSYMVQVTENDEPDYLESKIQSDTGSIQVNLSSNGESEALSLDIEPEWFVSTDDSIIVDPTSSYIDFRSTGKVACTSGDTLDFLNQKINVDPSIASLITLEKQNSQILIKSALSGTGILIVNNGQISTVAIPTDGNYLLSNTSGSLGWIAYADCDNACEQE